MTYQEFIDSRRGVTLPEPYVHNHHIIPVSVGGVDDDYNRIRLSYEDHWIAHKLLAEENPDNEKLVKAFTSLGTLEQFVTKHIRRYDKVLGSTFTRSEEIRKKISERQKGKVLSEETRRKISESNRGKVRTEEQRQNIAKGQLGHTLPEEAKKSISEKAKERLKDKENHPLYGKKHSEESIKKMSEAHKGNTATKGRKWFTNGIINKMCVECPDGFWAGITRKAV